MANYQIIKQIGKGGSGVVYKAWHAGLKKFVVLKELVVNTDDMALLRHEVDVLKNVRHSYLPQVYDFFSLNNKMFLVEDFIEGKDLDRLMKEGYSFTEAQLVKWLKQLCQVLQYLHTRKPAIIHSDIKPANIIIDQRGDVCLIDFNIAVMDPKKGSVMGFTRGYAPPEQVELSKAFLYHYHSGNLRLDARSDLYSLAATFYTLMTRQIPPERGERPLSSIPKLPYSQPLCSLLDRAMRQNPAQRYQSAREMERALNHLERLTKSYRVYWWARLGCCVLGLLLMGMGGIMIAKGVQTGQYDQYRQEYLAIETQYQAGGATAEVMTEIESLLNNDRYTQIRRNRGDEVAQVYAVEAEYYFRQDTPAGYQNAVYYYGQAMNCAESEAAVKTYARNYASALAMSGQTAAAQGIVSTYLTGVEAQAVEAELLIYQQDYRGVLALVENLSAEGASGDLLGDLYETAGTAAEHLGEWQVAASWQEKAVSAESKVERVRKLVYFYLKAGELDRTAYQKALDAYGLLQQPLEQDKLYAALAQYELGHNTKSMELLRSVEESSPNSAQLCQCYFYEALNYSASGKTENAASACKKAVKQFQTLTAAQRESIDQDGLFALAELLQVDIG